MNLGAIMIFGFIAIPVILYVVVRAMLAARQSRAAGIPFSVAKSIVRQLGVVSVALVVILCAVPILDRVSQNAQTPQAPAKVTQQPSAPPQPDVPVLRLSTGETVTMRSPEAERCNSGIENFYRLGKQDAAPGSQTALRLCGCVELWARASRPDPSWSAGERFAVFLQYCSDDKWPREIIVD